MLIKKGNTVLDVSKGAYSAFFAPQGWVKAEPGQTPKQKGAMMPQPEPEPEKAVPVEVPFGNMISPEQSEPEEDPIAYNVVYEEMTIKELTEFAEQHNIDLAGATRKIDIVAVIRKAMEG